MSSLLCLPPRVRDGRGNRVRRFPNGLVLQTNYNDDDMADVWKGALALGYYLEQTYGQGGMAGVSVLELGAGVGYCGLTASILGAKEVVLSDRRELLNLLHTNVALNHETASTAAATELDWSHTHLPAPYDDTPGTPTATSTTSSLERGVTAGLQEGYGGNGNDQNATNTVTNTATSVTFDNSKDSNDNGSEKVNENDSENTKSSSNENINDKNNDNNISKSESKKSDQKAFDLVLASDTMYEVYGAELFARVLARLFAPPNGCGNNDSEVKKQNGIWPPGSVSPPSCLVCWQSRMAKQGQIAQQVFLPQVERCFQVQSIDWPGPHAQALEEAGIVLVKLTPKRKLPREVFLQVAEGTAAGFTPQDTPPLPKRTLSNGYKPKPERPRTAGPRISTNQTAASQRPNTTESGERKVFVPNDRTESPTLPSGPQSAWGSGSEQSLSDSPKVSENVGTNSDPSNPTRMLGDDFYDSFKNTESKFGTGNGTVEQNLKTSKSKEDVSNSESEAKETRPVESVATSLKTNRPISAKPQRTLGSKAKPIQRPASAMTANRPFAPPTSIPIQMTGVEKATCVSTNSSTRLLNLGRDRAEALISASCSTLQTTPQTKPLTPNTSASVTSHHSTPSTPPNPSTPSNPSTANKLVSRPASAIPMTQHSRANHAGASDSPKSTSARMGLYSSNVFAPETSSEIAGASTDRTSPSPSGEVRRGNIRPASAVPTTSILKKTSSILPTGQSPYENLRYANNNSPGGMHQQTESTSQPSTSVFNPSSNGMAAKTSMHGSSGNQTISPGLANSTASPSSSLRVQSARKSVRFDTDDEIFEMKSPRGNGTVPGGEGVSSHSSGTNSTTGVSSPANLNWMNSKPSVESAPRTVMNVMRNAKGSYHVLEYNGKIEPFSQEKPTRSSSARRYGERAVHNYKLDDSHPYLSQNKSSRNQEVDTSVLSQSAGTRPVDRIQVGSTAAAKPQISGFQGSTVSRGSIHSADHLKRPLSRSSESTVPRDSATQNQAEVNLRTCMPLTFST